MNSVVRTGLFLVLTWLVSVGAIADTIEPFIGIVNRTNCGSFWRYDFNYETMDADGETPIVLSAAIFMSTPIHDKTMKAKGCGLLNHFTITADYQRPTNITKPLAIEGALSSTNYILIESDGFGFGIGVRHDQRYLLGRATARVNIDAFLAGKALMKDEGYEWEDVTINLGYSQGGHGGMWVNRLVAEGYRSSELPKIDYCIIGGGSYDMYGHYQKLVEDNLSQYPVSLPMIISGMISTGKYHVRNEDIFSDEVIAHLPRLLDSKEYSTNYINNFLYELFGHADDHRMPLDQLMKAAFFDEKCPVMEEVVSYLKQNSLVYEPWKPEKTDRITFVHTREDEVVPFLNQEHMTSHLLANGYEAFDVDDSSEQKHTDTGTYYAIKAIALLGSFTPMGIERVSPEQPCDLPLDIYGLDGRLIRQHVVIDEVYQSLPKGIYVINGQKIFKR